MKLYKVVNGEKYEMTAEEIAQIDAECAEAEYQERIRPRTMSEGITALVKSLIAEKITASEDKTLGIQCMALFPVWKPDIYSVGDVRTDPDTGYPYECILAHDSVVNTGWTIKERTLWKPWHSRSADSALPWEQPTGAHDMYLSGEYMIWTDKKVKKCLHDTNFSPDEDPTAWEDA